MNEFRADPKGRQSGEPDLTQRPLGANENKQPGFAIAKSGEGYAKLLESSALYFKPPSAASYDLRTQ